MGIIIIQGKELFQIILFKLLTVLNNIKKIWQCDTCNRGIPKCVPASSYVTCLASIDKTEMDV